MNLKMRILSLLVLKAGPMSRKAIVDLANCPDAEAAPLHYLRKAGFIGRTRVEGRVCYYASPRGVRKVNATIAAVAPCPK